VLESGRRLNMRWIRSGRALVAVVALVAAVALSLGLWSSWPAQAQDTWIINDNTDPTEDGCDAADFDDIQAAIDSGLVEDDDTLVVCEGIYDGGIEVDKKLTIEGREGADVSEVIVEVTAGTASGITLQADGAVVRNLFLEGPGPGGPDVGDGVLVEADHCTVSGVEARHWTRGVSANGSEGTLVEESKLYENVYGLVVANGSSNEVRQNEVTDNTDGGMIIGGEDQTLVEENLISENDDVQVLTGDYWLSLGSPAHIQFARNDIETKADADGIDVRALHADSFIQIGGSPARGNNFSGPHDEAAGQYYVEMPCYSENTVDATYNWWGSTDRSDITRRIFNDADDPARGFTECSEFADQYRGAVVFDPWAEEVWTPTTTPTPTPSPTATPTATPSPTATPVTGARDFDLQLGWNNFVWTGADTTAPDTALSCIAGDYAIAYRFVATDQTFQRYVPGNPVLSNMTDLEQYDSLNVLVTASGVQCLGMPVEP
jgi:parallel beta-helix repeat protein